MFRNYETTKQPSRKVGFLRRNIGKALLIGAGLGTLFSGGHAVTEAASAVDSVGKIAVYDANQTEAKRVANILSDDLPSYYGQEYKLELMAYEASNPISKPSERQVLVNNLAQHQNNAGENGMAAIVLGFVFAGGGITSAMRKDRSPEPTLDPVISQNIRKRVIVQTAMDTQPRLPVQLSTGEWVGAAWLEAQSAKLATMVQSEPAMTTA